MSFNGAARSPRPAASSAGPTCVGMLTAEQLIGHEPERIHIVGGVGLAAAQHLAARVPGRERRQSSGVERVRRAIGLACKPRDAEVEDLRHALAGGERIAGLEVAVNDTALVRIGESRGETADQAEGALARQAARLRAYERIERRAIEKLHRDEGLAAARIHIEGIDGGDVRVRESARLACFALERHLGILLALHVAAQQLDGEVRLWVSRLLEQKILRLPHLAHRARAEQHFEPVASRGSRCRCGHHGRLWPGSGALRRRRRRFRLRRGRIRGTGSRGARAVHQRVFSVAKVRRPPG